MNITIKNLKHSEFASRETNCFQCTVYVDGKRSFHARNDGNGGESMFEPIANADGAQWQAMRDTLAKIDEHCKTLPAVDVGGGHTYQPDHTTIIDHMVTDALIIRDVKKIMRRKVVTADAGGVVREYTFKGVKKIEQRHIDSVASQRPDEMVLNQLADAEILEIITQP